MRKLRYLWNRITNMDYKKMYETAKIVHQRCGKNTLATMADMIWCGFKYMAGYMDYLVFEFYRLNRKQRATYVTRGVNDRIVRALNQEEYRECFHDKIKFFRLFSNYLGREWMDLRDHTAEDFALFLEKADRIVVKPIDGTGGKGIEMHDVAEIDDPTSFFERVVKEKKYLVEQYVTQHHEISEIYPRSVNTIRLVTILSGDEVHLVFSSIRIGNGKTVDNLNSGGMAAIVDETTGCISTVAADKEGKIYTEHPYTGTTIVGKRIPMYEEAVAMVKEAARVVPQIRYVGWDVAITEEKPILIEANYFPGHDIYQFQVHLKEDRIGLLPKFRQALENENLF